MMHLSELKDDILDEIIYRGEGNSSIVIALKSRVKVIRLLKKDGKIMKSSQDHHVTRHPMRSIKFIHLIMKPLTHPFLCGVELVHLKSSFINKLSRRVEAERPVHRLNKTLHLDDQYALVMDDLCALPTRLTKQLHPRDLCGPTMSIEIKPKQGFLPIVGCLIKAPHNGHNQGIVTNCCLYWLHQHLKLARGRISEISRYCPINLFSGCPIKMRSALQGLVQNPQNNLRIFEDRTLAFDESCQSKLSHVVDNFFPDQDRDEKLSSNQPTTNPADSKVERLIDLILQCLLNENSDRVCAVTSTASASPCIVSANNENSFLGGCSGAECSRHSRNLVECDQCDLYRCTKKRMSECNSAVVHKLPVSCVLSSVLEAQKLDTIGAHQAHQMLEWLLDDAKSKDKNLDILEELIRPQKPAGFGSPNQLPHESKQQFYFRKVWEFLVSLTAKDCSIIITIRRIFSENQNSVSKTRSEVRNHLLREHKTGHYYLFNVGIADLDQKMPLKIARICENLNQINLQTQDK